MIDLGIHFGDARELGSLVDDQSVDLIFTDPPYPRDFLPLYGWLGEWAARVLKPDGFLLTYAGVYYKDQVFGLLGQNMEYFFDYIEYNQGNSTILWPKKTISRYKSILAYRPKGGDGMPVTNVIGVYFDDGKIRRFGDKRFHKWGQRESTARYFMEVFTEEGDLIVDPFLGGGTTAVVAERMSRPWIGFEIDEESFETSRQRLSGESPIEWPVQFEMFEVDEED